MKKYNKTREELRDTREISISRRLIQVVIFEKSEEIIANYIKNPV